MSAFQDLSKAPLGSFADTLLNTSKNAQDYWSKIRKGRMDGGMDEIDEEGNRSAVVPPGMDGVAAQMLMQQGGGRSGRGAGLTEQQLIDAQKPTQAARNDLTKAQAEKLRAETEEIKNPRQKVGLRMDSQGRVRSTGPARGPGMGGDDDSKRMRPTPRNMRLEELTDAEGRPNSPQQNIALAQSFATADRQNRVADAADKSPKVAAARQAVQAEAQRGTSPVRGAGSSSPDGTTRTVYTPGVEGYAQGKTLTPEQNTADMARRAQENTAATAKTNFQNAKSAQDARLAQAGQPSIQARVLDQQNAQASAGGASAPIVRSDPSMISNPGPMPQQAGPAGMPGFDVVANSQTPSMAMPNNSQIASIRPRPEALNLTPDSTGVAAPPPSYAIKPPGTRKRGEAHNPGEIAGQAGNAVGGFFRGIRENVQANQDPARRQTTIRRDQPSIRPMAENPNQTPPQASRSIRPGNRRHNQQAVITA